MKVAVCIKQVPENPTIDIASGNGIRIKASGKLVINPFDLHALEEGIRLKERLGCKVTAVSMGAAVVTDSLREALATGADEAVLLSDPLFEGSDTLATSFILAAAFKKMGVPEMIICGREAMDGDTGQVSPQLAAWLGISFVPHVSKVEDINTERATVMSMADDGYRRVEMALPGLISVVKELNVPRLPSLRGLMQSKKAAIPTWTAADLGIDGAKVGTAGSAMQIVRAFKPVRAGQSESIEGSPEEMADKLLEKLRGASII